MRSIIIGISISLTMATTASAKSGNLLPIHALFCSETSIAESAVPTLAFPVTFVQQDPQPLHAGAIEHSDAYVTRRKIHKIASFATLPLFATELVLGQNIYSNPSTGAVRSAHILVGTGLIGLFGVNTVTGAWNMFGEDRQDPNGRMLRLVHGLLMLASDAGFAATSMTGPNSDSQRQALTYPSRAALHRNLAVASISVGTAGYLLMLFGNH